MADVVSEVVEQSASVTNIIKDTFTTELQKYRSDNTLTRQMETQLEIIDLLAPLLIKTMASAIEKVVSDNQKTSVCEAKVDSLKESIQKATLAQRYTFDKLEAHDREDNLIFLNIEEPETGFESDEVIEQKIIDVLKDINIELKNEHISVAHRIGKKLLDGNGMRVRNDNGSIKSRPVIVRFSKKAKKFEIARKKKGLKGKSDVIIYEDLTSIRRGLLNVSKEQSCVKACYSKAGRIMVRLHSNESEEIAINSHEDLHKIGVQNFNDWPKLNMQDCIL